jgi:hypothetical protein
MSSEPQQTAPQGIKPEDIAIQTFGRPQTSKAPPDTRLRPAKLTRDTGSFASFHKRATAS